MAIDPSAPKASPHDSPAKQLETQKSTLSEDLGCLGCLGLFGVLFLIIPVLQLLLPTTLSSEPQQRTLNRWGWVAGSAGVIVLAGAGSWGLDLLLKNTVGKQKRLKDVFFQLIDQRDGQISVLEFARLANVTGPEARKFLDQQAAAFNGTFEPGENGGVLYQFER